MAVVLNSSASRARFVGPGRGNSRLLRLRGESVWGHIALSVEQAQRKSECDLTPRWSGRVQDKVPSPIVGARAAQLNR
jgi:hypothetical protein